MRRRELLATLASATAAATAGCDSLGESMTGERESEQGPVTVETIDAPGSDAGTVTVPAPDRVTFVEFFATTCDICASQMPVVGEAYQRVDDDVQFLSVTSEPVGLSVSKEEVASWWADHDGSWPVATDDGTTLARRYDATSVPTAVVIDADGTVTWSHSGRVETATLVEEIQSARAGGQA
ncbi:MAG: TlpA disulfide reductase family protein [Haloarculaceae archaeon]